MKGAVRVRGVVGVVEGCRSGRSSCMMTGSSRSNSATLGEASLFSLYVLMYIYYIPEGDSGGSDGIVCGLLLGRVVAIVCLFVVVTTVSSVVG